MMKGGLGNLMRQAQQMQETMKKAQAELAELEVTGESGAGMVRVILNGHHEAKKVTIEPKLPRRRTLAARYARIVGIGKGLPPDLARNLDHYIHGQPKQP